MCIMAHMFSHAIVLPSSSWVLPFMRRVGAVAAFVLMALVPAPAIGQSAGGAAANAEEDPALRFRMPTVTVTAQKEPEDKQKVPVSVTAVSQDTIDAAAVHIVSHAAIFAPNTFFTEWSARKLSNARF